MAGIRPRKASADQVDLDVELEFEIMDDCEERLLRVYEFLLESGTPNEVSS
jgi:hypothetical protein